MQRIQSRNLLWILFISLSICTQAQSGPPDSSSKIIEKTLPFPFPVQWTTNNVEISLIHVAWVRQTLQRCNRKVARRWFRSSRTSIQIVRMY